MQQSFSCYKCNHLYNDIFVALVTPFTPAAVLELLVALLGVSDDAFSELDRIASLNSFSSHSCVFCFFFYITSNISYVATAYIAYVQVRFILAYSAFNI